MRILFREKCIESKEYPGLTIEACELDPGVRNILVQNPLTYTKMTKFLSFPYVQLGLVKTKSINSVFAGMSKKPFDCDADKSHPLPLPNCYSNFFVCGIRPKSFDELCQTFWYSLFHGTAYDGCTYLQKSSMKNINVWQKMTLMAPEFILSEGCNYGSPLSNFKENMKTMYRATHHKFEKIQ